MVKPTVMSGYTQPITDACERVLVSLVRHLGPYAESIYLIGGLAPRYLVSGRPPEVPPHAGTGDVDVVIDMTILAGTEAYATLEGNLKRMGFERAKNDSGQVVSWRWQARLNKGETIILEFLAEAPPEFGGRVQELPTEGSISAMGIPHASIVFDHHGEVAVTAELLDGDGVVTSRIRHADIVSFVCLKAFAFAQRGERKDAHDLVYCLDHVDGGEGDMIDAFKAAIEGKHRETIARALELLRDHFCDDDRSEGYRKDGPVKAARFERGEDDEDEDARNARLVRQREVSATVSRLLAALGMIKDIGV